MKKEDYLRFNLNDHVKVKLNDAGVKLWRQEYEKYLSEEFKKDNYFERYYKQRTDDEGYTEFALWDFMNIFGPHFSMGFNQPTDVNIYLPKLKLQKP